jgi:hypothetical protein
MSPDRQIDRRGFLATGAGFVLLSAVGCTAPAAKTQPPSPESSAGAATPAGSVTPAPTPTPTRSPGRVALPTIAPWQPSPSDVEPAAKRRAVRVIEAIGSWAVVSGGATAAAASRVSTLGEASSLARQVPSFLDSANRAVVEVIDAQYGGILVDTASVLVVCRQWHAGDKALTQVGTTIDVRLRRVRGHWHVTALYPAHPGRPAAALSPLARRVLQSSRIELPAASAADVRSGQVHDSVLTTLLALAEQHRIGVSVVRSGHPKYVFDTTRLSDHPRGRAFDTWRIDGHAVVDTATPKSLVVEYMRAAAAAGSYNVGGPYLLSSSGSRFFSDATHHDHVHAGFLN